MSCKARSCRKESVNSKRRAPSKAAEVARAPSRRQTRAADIRRLAETGGGALTPQGVLRLQRGFGNRAVARLLSGSAGPHAPEAGAGGQVIQAKAEAGRGVVQRVMTPDELRRNARVQALKPQVDALEAHITNNTLNAQTLPALRGLRGAVATSIDLRISLNRALGADPGHATRVTVEQGFRAAVDAEIRTKEAAEAAAARAAENARLAAGPSLLPRGASWGRRA